MFSARMCALYSPYQYFPANYERIGNTYCHQCGILALEIISGSELLPDLLDWWTGTGRLSWQGLSRSGTVSLRETARKKQLDTY